MPRFVILWHDTPASYGRPPHFDLMLERLGVLWTWALPELPPLGATVVAERLPDHRLDYLIYEGLIAGDRGSVSRIAAGDYEVLDEAPCAMTVRLRGTEWVATIVLKQPTSADPAWRVTRLA